VTLNLSNCLKTATLQTRYTSQLLDHETAQSAVRNLNGKEVGGRPLRIDLADSDPLLEGRSTSFGELLEGEKKNVADNSTESWLSNLPQGLPIPPGKTSLDVITNAVVGVTQGQIYEILHDLKASTIIRISKCFTHPDQIELHDSASRPCSNTSRCKPPTSVGITSGDDTSQYCRWFYHGAITGRGGQ
jgi:hypothetical protein